MTTTENHTDNHTTDGTTVTDPHTLLQEATDDRTYLRSRVTDLSQELVAVAGERDLATVQRDVLQERFNNLESAARRSGAQLEARTAEFHTREGDNQRLITERDELRGRYDDLMSRFDSRGERFANLRLENERLLTQVNRSTQELASFKEQVVEVASEAASEHGWCDTIDSILGELGLKRAAIEYRGTLQVTVQFTAQMADRRELPDEYWVRQSMDTDAIERAITSSFQMDSDHSSGSVDDVEFIVTDVRDND